MENSKTLIYMDNGATSFPKPPAVAAAMTHFLEAVGGSPGRAGHRLSQEASRMVFHCREGLAELFGIPDSRRIAFTLNATEALNLALLGLLRDGDRVVTTSMEHNSVMRPLRHLEKCRRIDLEVVPADELGRTDPADLEKALGEKTRLLAVNHVSNVTGAVLPLEIFSQVARRHGVLFLVDAAQSAGLLPIDVEADDGIDLLAFTGHKGLLGPQGTGGLWVREGVDVAPLLRGGTGSNSELEEQPDFYPDRFESGTQNAVGIAGLGAAVDFIREQGVARIAAHEKSLTSRLLEGLADVDGIKLYGPGPDEGRSAVVSINFEGLQPSEGGFMLDEGFGVLSRVGLHCAPGAHRTIGTYPSGTVRLVPGFFTTEQDVDHVVRACRHIAGRVKGAS
jgi:cysteine desulfurase family protein